MENSRLGNAPSWRRSDLVPTFSDVLHCRTGSVNSSTAMNQHGFGQLEECLIDPF